ncbi:MAG: helix-turn-helix transcriptional regulator [Ilumatobacteraceae bacterium]
MPANPDIEYMVRGPESFGMAVREFRLREGLTQSELAKRANIHRTYLSLLETGTTTEALKNLMRVLSVLDLEIVIGPKQPKQ